jgi:ATP-dependent protease Clp ATPase subunit
VRGWRSDRARGDRPKQGELACSFCGKRQREVRKLIVGHSSAAGPGFVAICDACAGKAGQALVTGMAAATPLSTIKPVLMPGTTGLPAEAAAAGQCSFCHKGPHQVAGLAVAAGATTANVTICDECLALCQEIITEEDS